MKRPISHLLVAVLLTALVIGVLGATVSAVTSTGTPGDLTGTDQATTTTTTGGSSAGTTTTTSATQTATATTTSGQGSSGQDDDGSGAGNQTIVDIASANPEFSTLVAAVQQAGLVETLGGPGPFTVFAPTNAAFDALPAGALDALLQDQQGLTSVLTYHVAQGEFTADEVVNMTSIQTVQGQALNVTVEGGRVMVDGANVTLTDIQASNGVIHVIDAVMLPPGQGSGGQGGSGNETPTTTTTATATTTGQGSGGQGDGTATPTATGTSGQGGSGQPGAEPGEYGCGQGWAYFDRTPGNQGGAYRQDDVDIESGGSGYVVAFVKSSEWLIYSVNIPESGMYRATLRASSPWDDRQVWVWVDGILEAKVRVENTGSFDSYEDVSAEIPLPAGNHYIRLQFYRDSQNLDYMEFERTGDLENGWPGSVGQGGSGDGAGTTTTTTTVATTTTSGQGGSDEGTATMTPTPTTTATSTETATTTRTATPTVTATSG